MRIKLAVAQGMFCLFFGASNVVASGLSDFRYPCFAQRQPEAHVEGKPFSCSQLTKPEVLEEILDTLKRLPNLRVSITGNADSSECLGDECVALSKRRAEAISTWLVANGVGNSQIVQTTGAGTSQPIYNGTDEEWSWANRCVAVDPLDGR